MTNDSPHRFAVGSILVFCGLLLVSGCANMPDPADGDAVAEYIQTNDPLEPTNRQVFAVNQGLDSALLKPITEVYRDTVPATARQGIQNFLANLRTPVVLLNDILQGDLDRTIETLARFLVNSTVGIFGLADAAAELGVPAHAEDFGQTLAVWGVPSGPFLMLPVFGPSNPRDTVGLVVDLLTDPFNRWASNSGQPQAAYSRAGAETVDRRAQNIELLNEVEKSSLDFYAAIRSLYRQRRAHGISNGLDVPEIQAGKDVEFTDRPKFIDEEVSRRE
ncbi:MAG: VacJ family lipoprotein [Rhodospirillales bacterium]|nr:VacJ family lipoprotein [Rhodospirillales bacterium]